MLGLIKSFLAGSWLDKLKNIGTFIGLGFIACIVLGYIRHSMYATAQLKVANEQLSIVQEKLQESMAQYQKSAIAWAQIYADMQKDNKKAHEKLNTVAQSTPTNQAYADAVVPDDFVQFVREGQ